MSRLLVLRPGEGVVVAGATVLFTFLLIDILSGGLVTRLDEDMVAAFAASDGGPRWAQSSADLGALGVSGGVVAVVTLVLAQKAWRLWPLVLTAANLAATGVVVQVVKAAVGREAPPSTVADSDYAGFFPSGHTATAVVCFGTAAFLTTALLGADPDARRTSWWRSGGDSPAGDGFGGVRSGWDGSGGDGSGGVRSGWDTAAWVGVAVGAALGVVVGVGTLVRGNHWPSDIAGGVLVGVVVLVTGFAAVRTRVGTGTGVRR